MKKYNELTFNDLLFEEATFPSFAAFCRELNIDIPQGSSKKSALAHLSQFCEISQNGRSLFVKKRSSATPKWQSSMNRWVDTIFDSPKIASSASFNISYENDDFPLFAIDKYSIFKAIGLSFEEVNYIIKYNKDTVPPDNMAALSARTSFPLFLFLANNNNNIESLLKFWVFRGYLASFTESAFYLEYKINSEVNVNVGKTLYWMDGNKKLLSPSQQEELNNINLSLLESYGVSSLAEIVKLGKWREFEESRARLSDYKYSNIRRCYVVEKSFLGERPKK